MGGALHRCRLSAVSALTPVGRERELTLLDGLVDVLYRQWSFWLTPLLVMRSDDRRSLRRSSAVSSGAPHLAGQARSVRHRCRGGSDWWPAPISRTWTRRLKISSP